MYEENAKGFDASAYQDQNSTPQRIDFPKARRAGMNFCAIRLASGGTVDEDADWNVKGAQDAGFEVILAYGLLAYWEAVSAAEQGRRCLDQFMRNPVDELYCDFERPNASFPALPSYGSCIALLTGWYGAVDPGYGRMAGFYGNAVSFQAIYPAPARTLQRPLWVAGWPTVPAGTCPEEFIKVCQYVPDVGQFPRWKIWQFSAHGNGPDLGCESLNVDLDLYNGTPAQMRLAYGKPEPQPGLSDHEFLRELYPWLVNRWGYAGIGPAI